MRNLKALMILTIVCSVTVVRADDEAGKKALTHDDYNKWSRVQGQTLSPNGEWLVYSLTKPESDPILHVQNLKTDKVYKFTGGAQPQITDDSKHVLFMIRPLRDEVEKAEKEDREPEDEPKAKLGILNLSTGNLTEINRVQSFRLPEESSGYVAYQPERIDESTAKQEGEGGEEEPARAGRGRRGRRGRRTAQTPPGRGPGRGRGRGRGRGGPTQSQEKTDGSRLVLRSFATGNEQSFAYVSAYTFSKNGLRLFYAGSGPEGSNDGVFLVDVPDGTVKTLLSSKGFYKNMALDEEGEQLAFYSNRDDAESSNPKFSLYYWKLGGDAPEAVVTEETEGIPAGWTFADRNSPSFSHNGERIFFNTAPKREPEPEEDEDDDEDGDPKVVVDIWHWKDKQLQPQQLLRVQQARNRSYQAVLHLSDRRVVQLATEEYPNVNVGARGDADIAVANSSEPYLIESSWDSPGYNDIYLVNVQTGKADILKEHFQGNASLSPEAKYLTWWDRHELAWFSMDVQSRKVMNISAAIPYPVFNEIHDSPSLPGSYGTGGWTAGDAELLLYDGYDVWATDPAGFWEPRCITDGAGRGHDLRFRVVRLDRDEPALDATAPLMLSALNMETMTQGFYTDGIRSSGGPEKIVMMDYRVSTPTKAEDADVFVFTKQRFDVFPDLWVSDARFENARQISDANPQQAEYSWGKAELVQWHSADGVPLKGILVKPDGFDPSKKNPLMVYFYEKNSTGLHRYVTPAAGGSSINYSFYVSRGYVLFVPDIPYRVGYPGESCEKAVLPGIQYLLDQGFIDRERIGVQGHSWGGYQIAHLVTRSNIFAAAEAGAPVSNMTSAYGGIRWGSGMSRMFQYEKTQSRIGGTLWEKPLRYLENSPIFWADKVETPLLMMHNDEDGAVPWYQGIEYFVALRRLSRPVWMFNYNGEAHGLRQRQNQLDWTIRMQQFFDHYLLGAPAPVWLVDGVPATMKGKTLGLELVGERSTDK